MKTTLRILALALFALLFTGCGTFSAPDRLQKFLDKIPATDLAKVEQSFSSPLWSNKETATDISVDADGLLDVGSAKAELKIPLWYTETSFSLDGWKQIPTAKQRAAAAAVKAAAKAARAEAAASKAKAAADTAAATAAKTP